MTHLARPLSILHLEDDPNDHELVRSSLDGEGIPFRVEHVATREGYVAALERGGLDLILSDFALPAFDGLSALNLAMQFAPEIPFIFVSGTIGEDAAILCVRSGARDYVLKNRLNRLGPAVLRAAQEAEEQRKLREAERALRHSEDQLRQAQKMEAIGRLAGGVAHDFNNLLTVILGRSQMLQARAQLAGEPLDDVKEILEAGNRASQLTRQLLAFSRQQVLDPRVLDLNALVADAHGILRRLIGADVDLRTVPGRELGRVRADAAQIGQIIMNLAVNARDAMPGGGSLTLETANVALDAATCARWHDAAPGPYVLLTVRDSGTGMDAATRARIFEPFYTTKEAGVGTGLGLSTVHGIVKQSGGHIEVLSEPGLGSTFKVYLPRVEAELESPDAGPAGAEAAGGTETVLLVEDEGQVRSLLAQALRQRGYTVIEAADGEEALQGCKSAAVKPDLLLADLVLPRLGGAELVRRLEAVCPGIRTVLISGYTDRVVPHQDIVGPGHVFLQKPFTLAALLVTVRGALDGLRQRAA